MREAGAIRSLAPDAETMIMEKDRIGHLKELCAWLRINPFFARKCATTMAESSDATFGAYLAGYYFGYAYNTFTANTLARIGATIRAMHKAK